MGASTSVQPGDVLAGKYRVERVIGAGGMGYVVAARHVQLDQLVAMKFLRRSAVDNVEAATRFLREAKAVVRLRGEHVAKVFDVGTLHSGEPYIVMEYLDGCDLSALTKRRGALPVSEACEYVVQACEALAEAHALGIIHRDIKLANLFVTTSPTGAPLVKVLDFGISKTNPFGESEHDVTRTASMLGSPRFMSPEQMRDPRAVDARSDVWSLGVVLYRLVAARPPFDAETLGALLTAVMHERQPPLSSVRGALPPGFEQIVARCLEKDPAMRPSNVADLAQALAPYAIDPARAAAAAERIAAVLRLPVVRAGTESSRALAQSSRSARPSSPPGVADTGTAAPWTGTRGSESKARAPNMTPWLGAGLAALLIGSTLFVMRRERAGAEAAHRAAATSIATTVAPPSPAPLEDSSPGALPSPGAPAAPAPESTTRAIEPAEAAGAEATSAPARATPTSTAHAAPTATPARREAPPPRPAARKPAPRQVAPPQVDDGIPATRD